MKYKLTSLHLFVILLAVLIICAVFGGSGDPAPFDGKWSTIEGMKSGSRKHNHHSNGAGDKVVGSVPSGNDGIGIPASQIPEGDEDLYILKSQVVPPVCPPAPAPVVINKGGKDGKCPPCKPCGRCPEPAFDCQKVPTFRASDGRVPVPVLADFTQFGM